MFLSSLEQTKTFQTGKKKFEIVRKSSVLFPLKPRYMETFRCYNKLIRFRSGFVFKLKKSPKCSDSIFKNFWNRLKRSAFVPIKSGPNQNVLVCFDSKLRYQNVCAFVIIIIFSECFKENSASGLWISSQIWSQNPKGSKCVCKGPMPNRFMQKKNQKTRLIVMSL